PRRRPRAPAPRARTAAARAALRLGVAAPSTARARTRDARRRGARQRFRRAPARADRACARAAAPRSAGRGLAARAAAARADRGLRRARPRARGRGRAAAAAVAARRLALLRAAGRGDRDPRRGSARRMLIPSLATRIAGRFGAQVAAGFAGHLAILLAATALLALGLGLVLGGGSLRPSPWPLAAPLSTAAALWTRQRLHERREDLAIAASGAALGVVALPAVVLALAVQLALCVPGELRARQVSRSSAAQPLVAVDGSLFVTIGGEAFHWPAAADRPQRAEAGRSATIDLPAG